MGRRHGSRLLRVVAIATGLVPFGAGAQVSAPVPGRAARLVVPTVASSALPNGVKLKVVEQHELPIVQVTAVIDGGAMLDGEHPGIATFTAGMLDEGAGGRDAAGLQSELAYLGASLGTTASWDAFTVSLKVPVRSLGPALDLMADVILRPTLASAEVRRQRDLRLAGLLQQRDQPNALAALAFNQVAYPAGHPYHRATGGDSASTAALDSATVRRFYEGAYRPDRATFVVVGDLSTARVTSELQARFGGWRGTGAATARPSTVPAPVSLAATTVYLVDKPDAAQSIINIGWPGVDRRSPDYAALMVMNALLGGAFTSRLNMTLREEKGYSYGARSGFAFRRVPGPFTASAAVRTNVTDSSLVEFFKELHRIRDTAPTADEVLRARNYVELALPGDLEGTSQVAAEVADLMTYGLPLTELSRFAAEVRRVSAADIQRVARRYLTPDRATVVVVGDQARVRAPIEALKLGELHTLDARSVAR